MTTRKVAGKRIAGALTVAAGAAAAAYAAAGDLDAAFGVAGVATVASGSGPVPDCVVQADGKVVAAASDDPGAGFARWRVARWNADGTLDAGFGTGGFATFFGASGNDALRNVELDGAGRALAAGTVYVTIPGKGGKSVVEGRATVARLTVSGALDASFGAGGATSFVVPNTTFSSATCLAVQPDGKIVVAGTAYPKVKGSQVTQLALFVARLRADGSLDTSFGSSGITLRDVTPADDRLAPGSLAIQSTGRILLATTSPVVVNNVSWQSGKVVRFTSSGAVDTAFGVVTGPNAPYDALYGLSVDSTDRIVAVGRRSYAANVGDMLAVRFGANGSLDASFGGGGVTIVHDTALSSLARAAHQADGRIVLAGYVEPNAPSSFEPQAISARLTADGALDAAYGAGGVTAPLGSNSIVEGLALVPGGGIVVSGMSIAGGSPSTFSWFVARYLQN